MGAEATVQTQGPRQPVMAQQKTLQMLSHLGKQPPGRRSRAAPDPSASCAASGIQIAVISPARCSFASITRIAAICLDPVARFHRDQRSPTRSRRLPPGIRSTASSN
jgi:hypothetical protein